LLARKVLFLVVREMVREMVQKSKVQLAGSGAQARRRHRQWCASGNNGGWVASLRATGATLAGCSSGGHGCRRNATPKGYLLKASRVVVSYTGLESFHNTTFIQGKEIA
jgi:hypothetical protein